MDEREIVSRAIHFKSPPRIGLRYAFDFARSDIVDLCYSEAEGTERATGEDEWGCVWSKLGGRIESSFGQVIEYPLESWSDYNPPDPFAPDRFNGFNRIDKYPTKYIAGSFPFPIFNRLMFLRGTKNLMKDFYLNTRRLRRLARQVLAFDREIIKAYVDLGLDGVWFGDDLASQKSLMFSPKIWKEFILPWYSDLFRWTHDAGMDVIFHTCGQTRLILKDLVVIGADALNLNQPELLGLAWLKEELSDEVSFFCPVDTQLIGSMKPEDVKANALALVDYLAGEEGGFVALCDEGKDHGTVSESNVLAMSEAFEMFRSLPTDKTNDSSL